MPRVILPSQSLSGSQSPLRDDFTGEIIPQPPQTAPPSADALVRAEHQLKAELRQRLLQAVGIIKTNGVNTMQDEEPLLEKTMASGAVMTLASSLQPGWFDVDQWDTEGNNRWHRQYSDYAKAKAEYDRWN